MAPLEIHLHLVELIALLAGVHKDDGEGQRAQKIDLRLGEHAQRDDPVHLLGLAERQPHKGDVILIGHHLHKAGQRRKPDIVPVRAQDAPVRHADGQVGLDLRRLALPGRNIAQRMGRLKDTDAHLGADGNVFILIEDPGYSRGRNLRRLCHVFDGSHDPALPCLIIALSL